MDNTLKTFCTHIIIHVDERSEGQFGRARKPIAMMILLLDGNSEICAHGNLIKSFELRSTAVASLFIKKNFSPERHMF